MMTLAIVSFLTGTVLGQRFNVFVLIPAIPAALIVALVVGIARADGVWLTVMMAALGATSVQIGYLAGTAIRVMIAATHAGRHHPSLQTSVTPQRRGH